MTVDSNPGLSNGPMPLAPLGALSDGLRVHREPAVPTEEDPNWFQRAIFYEVFIRGFFDGNNDGVGDIPELHRQARLSPVAGGGLPLAAAVLPIAPP